jgi:hypothetical protein
MRKAVLGASTLMAVVAAFSLVGATDCQIQGKCEYVDDPSLVDAGKGSLKSYCFAGDPTCHGRLIDPNTWESSPITEGLLYGAQRVWDLHPRGIQGRIYEVVPYIAASIPDPKNDATQWVIAPGNLAEVKIVNDPNDPFVRVHNDTCAEYYLRVVVRAAL